MLGTGSSSEESTSLASLAPAKPSPSVRQNSPDGFGFVHLVQLVLHYPVASNGGLKGEVYWLCYFSHFQYYFFREVLFPVASWKKDTGGF